MIRLIASGPKDYADLIGADTWRGYAVPPGGLEPEPVLRMLQGWAARLQAAQGWGSWLAVTELGPEMEGVAEVVASLAIKDVAKDGRVEIGYGAARARPRDGGGSGVGGRACRPGPDAGIGADRSGQSGLGAGDGQGRVSPRRAPSGCRGRHLDRLGARPALSP